HWGMLSSRMKGERAAGNFVRNSGTRTVVEPARAAENRSKVERSKWKGAWLLTRSACERPYSPAAQVQNARALACVWTMPLGVPVDPEVYRMYARSHGPTIRSGADSWHSCISSHGRQGSPPPMHIRA